MDFSTMLAGLPFGSLSSPGANPPANPAPASWQSNYMNAQGAPTDPNNPSQPSAPPGILNGATAPAAPGGPGAGNGANWNALMTQAQGMINPKTAAPSQPQIQMARAPGSAAGFNPTQLLAAMRATVGQPTA